MRSLDNDSSKKDIIIRYLLYIIRLLEKEYLYRFFLDLNQNITYIYIYLFLLSHFFLFS